MDDFKVVIDKTKNSTKTPIARKKMNKWFWFKIVCLVINSFFFGFFSARLRSFVHDELVTSGVIFKTFGWLIGIFTICFIYCIASLVREFYQKK